MPLKCIADYSCIITIAVLSCCRNHCVIFWLFRLASKTCLFCSFCSGCFCLRLFVCHLVLFFQVTQSVFRSACKLWLPVLQFVQIGQGPDDVNIQVEPANAMDAMPCTKNEALARWQFCCSQGLSCTFCALCISAKAATWCELMIRHHTILQYWFTTLQVEPQEFQTCPIRLDRKATWSGGGTSWCAISMFLYAKTVKEKHDMPDKKRGATGCNLSANIQ